MIPTARKQLHGWECLSVTYGIKRQIVSIKEQSFHKGFFLIKLLRDLILKQAFGFGDLPENKRSVALGREVFVERNHATIIMVI